MFVVCVNVWVKEGREEAFIAATRANHLGTRREPGNVRFDVLRKEDEPDRFMLYEVYRTREDFGRHQETPHYLEWRETVADLMARPREGLKYASLVPADGAW